MKASIAPDDLMISRKSEPVPVEPLKEMSTNANSRHEKTTDPVQMTEPENESPVSAAASNIYVQNQKSYDKNNFTGTWSFFGLSLLFNVPLTGPYSFQCEHQALCPVTILYSIHSAHDVRYLGDRPWESFQIQVLCL